MNRGKRDRKFSSLHCLHVQKVETEKDYTEKVFSSHSKGYTVSVLFFGFIYLVTNDTEFNFFFKW